MAKKFKKLIFLTILFIVATGAHNAYAERNLEIRYPDFGDITMDVQTVDVFLPNYIRYVFQFMVIISGFIAFGALVFSGVALLASAGNPAGRKQATDQISAAILGIAIILGSFLISRTINPMLVSTIPGIDAIGGITVYDTANCPTDQEGLQKTTLTSNILDLYEEHEFNALSLKFNSHPGQLDVIVFPGANYEGGGKRIKHLLSKDCYNFSPSINSIKLYWQMPGVYLCDTDYEENGRELFCGGPNAVDAKEKLLSYDTALLTNEIQNNLGGLRFEQNKKIIGKGPTPNDPEGHIKLTELELQCEKNYHGRLGMERGNAVCYLDRYGVILHENADWTGACEIIAPAIGTTSYSDGFINFAKTLEGTNPFTEKAPVYPLKNTSSITSFTVREDDQAGGVYLCEEANPRQTKNPKCSGPFTSEKGNFGDDSPGSQLTSVSDASSCADEWLNADGTSSIIIDGNYLVVLFDGQNYTGLCEVFKHSDSNLIDNPIGSCCQVVGPWGRSDCASSAIIIPIEGSESTGGWTPTTPTTCGEHHDPSECFDVGCYFNYTDRECFSSIQPCNGEGGVVKPCSNEGGGRCSEINGDRYWMFHIAKIFLVAENA